MNPARLQNNEQRKERLTLMVTIEIKQQLRKAPITVEQIDFSHGVTVPQIVLVSLTLALQEASRTIRIRLDRSKRRFIDQVADSVVGGLITANAPIIIAIVEECIMRSKRPST